MKPLQSFKSLEVLLQTGLLLMCFLMAAVFAAPGPVLAQTSTSPLPVVAIHVSENTQAFATMPASGSTPTGAGTTGYQWFYTSWNYFVGYESLEEALRSDGTPFVTVTDAQIAAGQLLNSNGTPRYPIVISLGSEAINTNEVAPLTAYVNAGGFLFAGSSSFTRNPNGTPLNNFALAGVMGINMVNSEFNNWYLNTVFTKETAHTITSHIPSGTLTWRQPLNSEQVPFGVDPDTNNYDNIHNAHWAFQVTGNGATILANGSYGPLLTVNSYGKGQVIWHGAFQPIVGHGGFDPGMYMYFIYRKAIEWAFQTFDVPILKVSPWRYPYDAAMMARHDFENEMSLITSIESSAQYEKSLGIMGDYYFCTGTLRTYTGSDKASIISGLQTAVKSYGATIGPHNGGLPNPANPSLTAANYDYYHWGPDEALNTSPAGYTNGAAYAAASLLTSVQDVEGWFNGLDNGRTGCGAKGNCPLTYVSPFFNGTREGSMSIIQQMGSITMGEQKISPFPHFTLSYDTLGLRYPMVSIPTSEWFVQYTPQTMIPGAPSVNDIGQELEQYTSAELTPAIDFYAGFGGLINFYGHNASNDGAAQQTYETYSIAKPALWSTNAVGISDWWNTRSHVVVTPSLTTSGSTNTLTASITGATDAQTAVEVVLPTSQGQPVTNLKVFLNGAVASPSSYRTTGYGALKILVGSSVSTVEVQYTVSSEYSPPVAVNDAYTATEYTPLTVAAPGVLANDTDPEGNPLTAQLATRPSHGTLTLNSNGSFTYTPTGSYTGTDSFTYTANDGEGNSNAATVTVTVQSWSAPVAVNHAYTATEYTSLTEAAPGVLANDTDPEGKSLTAQLATGPSDGTLTLNANGSFTYTPTGSYTGTDSFTYVANDGEENSSAATVTITVQSWSAPVAVNHAYTATEYTSLTEAAPGVLANDTDPEGKSLTAQLATGPSDGTLTLSANGSFTYTPTGSFTGTDSFTYTANDGEANSNPATVTITVQSWSAPVAVNDAYTATENTPLTEAAPGVLANDTDPEGKSLTAQLATGPSHGALTLNSDGSFTYTPVASYTGADSFTYVANDGEENSNTATAAITVQSATNNFPYTGILDTFSRANQGPPPSSSWTTSPTVTGAGLKVVNDACVGSLNGQENIAYWNTSFGPNTEAYVTMSKLPNTGYGVILFARFNFTTQAGYYLQMIQGRGLTLFAENGDNYTQIGSTVTGTYKAGDSFGLQIVGSTLNIWYKPSGGTWTLEASYSDSTFTSAGNIGLDLGSATGAVTNFGGGTH